MRAIVPPGQAVDRGRVKHSGSATKPRSVRRTLLIVFFIGITCISCGRTANAAPFDEEGSRSVQGKDWSVRTGALGIHKPAYEGSDDYELSAFPLIDVTVGETFFYMRARAWGPTYGIAMTVSSVWPWGIPSGGKRTIPAT